MPWYGAVLRFASDRPCGALHLSSACEDRTRARGPTDAGDSQAAL